MISKVCFACLVLCCVLDWQSSYVVGLSKQEREQDILLKLIDESRYDKRVRPSGQNDKGATIVTVNFYVRSVDFIDDVKMDYGVSLTFRQQWLDKRLAYTAGGGDNNTKINYLTLIDRSQIWIPDLFFSNEKTSHLHDLMRPNHYIRIWPNGEVLYSSRITLSLRCPMLMKTYPFDKQTCSMRMASYGYTKDDIIFKWKEVDPVQVTSDLHIPRFSLEQFTTDYCDSSTNTGTYSCVRADFLLKREFRQFLIYIYIPCMMVIIVAWLGCFLDRKSVTARILIALSTLFVLATQITQFNTSLPKVSYTKAIDVYTGMSMTFVFVCFVEFIVVNYLSRMEDEEKANKAIEESRETANNEEVPLNEKNADVEIQQPKKNIRKAAENYMSRFPCKSQKVDAIFRIAFPIVYGLFLIIYFAAY